MLERKISNPRSSIKFTSNKSLFKNFHKHQTNAVEVKFTIRHQKY